MTIVLPNQLEEGQDADATQVMANLNALREAVEGFGVASTASDVYQAGVLASTDWVVVGKLSIAAGTGAFTLTTGGSAWLPGPSSGLVRIFNASGEVLNAVKPSALPAAAAYMNIGIELTASGASAVAGVVSGVEKASEAEAIAAPAPVTAGKMRICDVIVHNTAGSYTAVASRDRRPWARGASSLRTVASVAIPELISTVGTLTQRVECTGRPLRIVYTSEVATGGGTLASLELMMDGVKLPPLLPLEGLAEFFVTPTAGSRLFTVQATTTAGSTKTMHNPFLGIAELVAYASNGTA